MPKQIQEYVLEIQKTLFKQSKGTILKPVKEVHLTLKFLGEIDENKINKIKETLKKIKFDKFNIKLNNTGVFPSETFIRVVWVGLEPEDIILKLQKQIDDAVLV